MYTYSVSFISNTNLLLANKGNLICAKNSGLFREIRVELVYHLYGKNPDAKFVFTSQLAVHYFRANV